MLNQFYNKLLCKFGLVIAILLLAACGGDSSKESFRNPAPSGDEDVAAVYSVNSADLSITLDSGESKSEYENTWATVVKLLPEDVLKSEVGQYHVFTDGSDGTDTDFVHTTVHEFGHIIALENDQVDPDATQNACSTYFIDEGCSKSNSYINQYFNAFWKGAFFDKHNKAVEQVSEAKREQAVADFYEANSNQFVSEYAATNPVEDFAEVFTYFVLGDRPINAVEVYNKKIDYLYRYPDLLNIRKHIRDKTAKRLSL